MKQLVKQHLILMLVLALLILTACGGGAISAHGGEQPFAVTPQAVVSLAHDLPSNEALPLDSAFTISDLLMEDLNGVELFGDSVELGVQRKALIQ